MPYAERVAPTPRFSAKSTTLPMPIAAFHNGEERRLPSLDSFVRRKCVEYFADDDSDGEVGLRCTFCRNLPPEEREPRSFVFPLRTVSIHAAVITLQYSHLPYCSEVSEAVVEHMEALKEKDAAALESGDPNFPRKRYRWAHVATEMGFRDTDSGMRFIPPENVGRKRQAVSSAALSSETSIMEYNTERHDSLTPPPRADWTDDDDLRLWKGQQKLGNRWKEVSEQVFKNSFRGDQVRNRWYSAAFKEAVSKRFGKDAYDIAQVQGKQVHGGAGGGGGGHHGGGGGPAPSVVWTPEEDMKLWNAQQELGNRWKEISARMGRSNSDNVKTRWYSEKFKDFIAGLFGKDAHKTAHVQGRQERQGAQPQVEWTEEDDRLLWLARQDMGNKWDDISTQRFHSRMGSNHVKNRWYSAGFKRFVALNYGYDAYEGAKIGRRGAQCQVDWTPEDDRTLWESHVEMGNRWGVISETRFMGRISENQVKNRWYSAPFKKYVAGEYGPDAHRNAKHRR